MYRGSEHIEHTTQYGGEVQLLHYRVLALKFVKIKKKWGRLNKNLILHFFTLITFSEWLQWHWRGLRTCRRPGCGKCVIFFSGAIFDFGKILTLRNLMPTTCILKVGTFIVVTSDNDANPDFQPLMVTHCLKSCQHHHQQQEQSWRRRGFFRTPPPRIYTK